MITIGEMFTRMERRTAISKQSVQEGWRSGKKRQREEDDGKEKELDLERKGKFRIFENKGCDANSQKIKRIKLQLVKPAQTRPGPKRPIE